MVEGGGGGGDAGAVLGLHRDVPAPVQQAADAVRTVLSSAHLDCGVDTFSGG